MELYKIKKLNSQNYTVEVSSWVLGMQLFNMKEFRQLKNKDNVYNFKTDKYTKPSAKAGEIKFRKLMKQKGIDLNRYPQI